MRSYAAHYAVSGDEMWKTIQCEDASLDPLIRGDSGHSRGLVQISDIYHPEITDVQADDPFFAIDFMAKYFAAGKKTQWTCWRDLKKQGVF